MPVKTKAVVAVAQGKVEVREYPLEPLHPRDARAKVNMNAICGSDVHWLFDEEKPQPHYGHEWVGTLVEIGAQFPGVDKYGQKLEVGDKVSVVGARCGKCYACTVLRQPNLCMGWPKEYPRPERAFPRNYGGMAEYFTIVEGSEVFKVPGDMPDEVATLADPLAISLYAMERAYQPGVPSRGHGMGPGQIVCIQGAGAIGLMLVALSRLSGAYKTVVIGAPQMRLDMCERFGADKTINIFAVADPAQRAAMVREMTPFAVGPDVVFEAAGVPAAFAEGIDLVRRGGTYVEVGHFSHRGKVEIDPYELCRKNINLFGSWTTEPPSDRGKALRLFEEYADAFPWQEVVTHRFELEEAQAAFELAKRQECMRAVVVP